MNHELFADFVYSKGDECWKATRPMAHLARLARSRFGDKSDQPADGMFAIRIADPTKAGPSPQQEAAFRHLQDNEAAIAQTVMTTLLRSSREYSSGPGFLGMEGWRTLQTPEGLTKSAQLTDVEISREHHHGQAYLVFGVDCDWEMEHGMVVVYHKDRPAEWTTYDGLWDLLESDEEVRAPELPPPPNQQLVEAILANDRHRVAALQAQGHNINDLGEDAVAPLSVAVEHLDVDLVKRLLAAGADPNLCGSVKRTPLQRAKTALANISLVPRKRDGWFLRLLMALGRMFARRSIKEMRSRLQEIIGLLVAAGAK